MSSSSSAPPSEDAGTVDLSSRDRLGLRLLSLPRVPPDRKHCGFLVVCRLRGSASGILRRPVLEILRSPGATAASLIQLGQR